MHTTFTSWPELLDHVAADYRLYYHAPMDYRPALVTATVRKDGKLRVTPVYSDADPFTADVAHLPRFRKA
jgi:hypothetical protein